MSILPLYVAACLVSVPAEDAASAAPHSRVVYLSASKTTFGTEQYRRVLDYIVRGFPSATILDAASHWRSAEHWRGEYEGVLSAVRDLFILPHSSCCCCRGGFSWW